MRGTRERGVTLIELVIAVTLVALLSVGILMAMRVGLNGMQKANARLLFNRRVTSVQSIVEQQIINMVPVIATCGAGAEGVGQRTVFFSGGPDSLRLVSAFSLQEAGRGFPRILEYKVIPGENAEGVRLVVNEHLYTGSAGAGRFCIAAGPETTPDNVFLPIQIGPGSFVLADKLAYCRFTYQGRNVLGETPQWFPRWTRPYFPTAVHIEMAPLHPEDQQLHVGSLTVATRITRQPMIAYGE